MSDIGKLYSNPHKLLISTGSPQCPAGLVACYANQTLTAAAWPTANKAIYAQILVEMPFTPINFFLVVGGASGNLDVGIYDEKFNRVVSKGSTLVGSTGVQKIDLTASVSGTASPVLNPGVYFLAMNCDNVVATFQRYVPLAVTSQVCGVQEQAVGSVTLPSSATPANPTAGYMPVMGITQASVM